VRPLYWIGRPNAFGHRAGRTLFRLWRRGIQLGKSLRNTSFVHSEYFLWSDMADCRCYFIIPLSLPWHRNHNFYVLSNFSLMSVMYSFVYLLYATYLPPVIALTQASPLSSQNNTIGMRRSVGCPIWASPSDLSSASLPSTF
jgi:hypothetical protein